MSELNSRRLFSPSKPGPLGVAKAHMETGHDPVYQDRWQKGAHHADGGDRQSEIDEPSTGQQDEHRGYDPEEAADTVAHCDEVIALKAAEDPVISADGQSQANRGRQDGDSYHRVAADTPWQDQEVGGGNAQAEPCDDGDNR